MKFAHSIPPDPPDPLLSKMCGSLSGHSIDKVKEAKLTPIDPETNSTPVVAEYPLTLECKVLCTQNQDLSLIPEEVRESDDPQEADRSNVPANRDPHTAYISRILSACRIT